MKLFRTSDMPGPLPQPPHSTADAAEDTKQQHRPGSKPRMYYMDWLRVFLLVFVAFNHVVMLGVLQTHGLPGTEPYHSNGISNFGVYGGVQTPVPDSLTYTIGRFLISASLAYNMGLFYLRAGYFSVPSYNRKGPWKFLTDRALRLGVPLLVWEMLLYPLVLYIGSAGQASGGSSVYQLYFKSFQGVGHLQMWFVGVLFAFDVVYVAARLGSAAYNKASTYWPQSTGPGTAIVASPSLIKDPCITVLIDSDIESAVSSADLRRQPSRQQLLGNDSAYSATAATSTSSGTDIFSTRFMLASIAALVIVLTLSMFVPMIFVGMQWNTQGITLQFSMLGQYAICHGLGTLMFKPRAFGRLPTRFGYWCLTFSIAIYTPAYFATAFLRSGKMAALPGSLYAPTNILTTAGIDRQADHLLKNQLLSTHAVPWLLFDSFVTQSWAVLFSIGLLVVFRQHLNMKPGKVGQVIINASYAFYILFPLILVSLAKAFESVRWHPFAFAAVVWPAAVIGSYALAVLVRVVPGASYVL